MTSPARWSDSIHPDANPNAEIDAAMRRALGHYDPPSFPNVIASALAKLRDPQVPLPEIARILSHDPRLTIKLLSLLNSAAYAFRRPVLSVEHAVTLLGRNRVESMLLSMGVRGVLHKEGQGGADLRFWHAAARRATVARTLAVELEEQNAPANFTAALLQDMAVPLLSTHVGDGYGELLGEWRNGSDLADLEDAEYGWNHADVAGWMCEHWRFPEELAGAIGAHHTCHRRYSSRPPPPVTMVACLREGDRDYGEDEFVDATASATGLGRDQLRTMVEEADREAASLSQAYV